MGANVTEIPCGERDASLIEALVGVWEASVRATHLFLSDAEIESIKAMVPGALAEVTHLVVEHDEGGRPVAFMGIAGSELAMIFIAPAARGHGLGRKLVEHAFAHYGVDEVTVNEQNPQARGFYEHMGFVVSRRSELDEQGMAYPILYMRRNAATGL